MNILLDDRSCRDALYPFCQVRSAAHIRVGILSIYEKWQWFFPGKVWLVSEPPGPPGDEPLVTVPASLVPSEAYLMAAREQLPAGTVAAGCPLLEYPWQITSANDRAIREDFRMITRDRVSGPVSPTNRVVQPEAVFIEPGATVEFSILNASAGPIYIGRDAQIEEGSLIRGPVSIGEGSRVKMGTRIYGATTIGPFCLAGGEIKNSVMTAYSNKGHDGYLGDSVIGSWCNLGAGTSNSNLKNTAAPVRMWSRKDHAYVEAGVKCGLLMGDYSRSAINTSFNTGTVVGVCCNVFGDTFQKRTIGDFSWGDERYRFDKAISDIRNWKQLKGMDITSGEIEALQQVYQTLEIK